MEHLRVRAGDCRPPFPVYEQLVDALLSAHTPAAAATRDATVAHVLGTCAGYAYSDIETVATIMARLGFESNSCACIAQTVDVMFIFSTAYLVQSRCGRVVILCYRGTEPTELLSWLGDADVGLDYFSLVRNDARPLRVHAGFHRNVRATRWAVLDQLQLARIDIELSGGGVFRRQALADRDSGTSADQRGHHDRRSLAPQQIRQLEHAEVRAAPRRGVAAVRLGRIYRLVIGEHGSQLPFEPPYASVERSLVGLREARMLAARNKRNTNN